MKLLIFYLLLAVTGTYGQDEQLPCIPRYFNYSSFACVCNATYCDTFPKPEAPPTGSYLVVTSDISQYRFAHRQETFAASANAGSVSFALMDEARQTILGFGGAVTDSAALNLLSLSGETQQKLLESYYSSSGVEYTLTRLNIGGCDFSSRGYTYADTEGDELLETFALQEEDLDQKIPILQRIAQMSPDPVLNIGAAWSAPAWMKTNNDLIGQGQLKEEYYQTWAEYHIKFLDAYAELGIPIWGISAQNEPSDGNIPNFSFNCMGWTAEQQMTFIARNLGPLLEERGYGDLKLMIMDDQRPRLPDWAKIVLNDTDAYRYVDGIAVHWYIDYFSPEPLTQTHQLFPDKFILYTEACEGDLPTDVEVKPGEWRRLETYARDIIEDLEHWVVGWIDWNIALNMQGGPNWCDNYVDSPVLVDASKDEFYKNPMFYAMGHFSKFIRPGAVHLTLRADGDDGRLDTTAFRNTDGSIVIVILNRHEEEVSVSISVPDRGFIQTQVLPRSLNSLLFI